jgi:hypothetical protein
MTTIEKRIVVDESTERVFNYRGEIEPAQAVWSGLLAVRDVHRLIGGLSYSNQLYAATGLPFDGRNIRLEFTLDQMVLIAQLRKLELVMTWKFQSDRVAGPRLTLDGTHTYWSPC